MQTPYFNLTDVLTLKINSVLLFSQTEMQASRKAREQHPLLHLHSSVVSSDADVLSTSLTSANGSCPDAAVQPHQTAALALSQHIPTNLDTCTYTCSICLCAHAHVHPATVV